MLLVVALILQILPFDFEGLFNKSQGHDKAEGRKGAKQRIAHRRRFACNNYAYTKKRKCITKRQRHTICALGSMPKRVKGNANYPNKK